jgi:hypothetical protein
MSGFSEIFLADRICSGYGEQLHTLPQNKNESWRFAFNFPDKKILTFGLNLLAVKRAKEMFAESGTEIAVFYSGGIDSEFVVNAFKQAAVPFRVVFFEFESGLNKHDLEWVEKFRSLNPDIHFEKIDFNVLKFLNSDEAVDLGLRVRCEHPHLLPLMKIVHEYRKAPVIIGAGEPFLIPHEGVWCLKERESIAALNRFFDLEAIKGHPAFFQSSPELFFSYLLHPVFQRLCSGQIPFKQHSLTSRIDIYREFFPVAERLKYHGYEKMEQLITEVQHRLQEKRQYELSENFFPYAQLSRRIEARNE